MLAGFFLYKGYVRSKKYIFFFNSFVVERIEFEDEYGGMDVFLLGF